MESHEEGGLTPALDTPVQTPESPEAQLRDQILAEQAEIDGDTHKVLPFPGRPLLRVRYHRNVDFRLVERSQKAMARREAGMLDVMLDLIIAACDEILGRTESGRLVPLRDVFPELGEGPARFTPSVARIFKPDAEIETARAAVLALIPEMAVLPHARELDSWLSFTDKLPDDDEEAEDDF